MRRSVTLLVVLLALVVAVGAACGGDDEGDGTRDGQTLTDSRTPGATDAVDGDGESGGPTPTSPVKTVESGGNATPASLPELRGELSSRLDGIGVNIGAVPDDVREQLLTSCRQLERFVDRERVDQICQTIEDAIEQGDPGLLDLAVQQLEELQAN